MGKLVGTALLKRYTKTFVNAIQSASGKSYDDFVNWMLYVYTQFETLGMEEEFDQYYNILTHHHKISSKKKLTKLLDDALAEAN